MEQWAQHVPGVVASTGVAATEAQVGQLAAYMAMLQRWNGTYNLTSLRSPEDMLTHHLADCLVVVAPLLASLQMSAADAQVKAPATVVNGAMGSTHKVLDVGSGGGLPGVVLAILCPALSVTCVDTVGKKAAFIRQVAAELGLPNLRAEHTRVEQLKGSYRVITSRAFASLVDFVNWTRHLLAADGVWMAMKGKSPDDELAVLPDGVVLDHIAPLEVPGLSAERCLVWLHRQA